MEFYACLIIKKTNIILANIKDIGRNIAAQSCMMVGRMEKGRNLMNFLVHSPYGTFFFKVHRCIKLVKNGDLLLKYLDDIIEYVGEVNTVQIITNNASTYKNVG